MHIHSLRLRGSGLLSPCNKSPTLAPTRTWSRQQCGRAITGVHAQAQQSSSSTTSPVGPVQEFSHPASSSNTLPQARAQDVAMFRPSSVLVAGAAALLLQSMALPGVAEAATQLEPANALSIPTWMIHISSVIEWTGAMILMWQYAEVTGNQKWKGMTWGMMPLFAGALSACTYHFFYNPPELDFLVAIQAGLTWIGNATLWIAAYRIYKDSQSASVT